MRRTFTLILMACFILLGNNVYAERIKDLTTVKGVRSNDLIGYGLVVGLNGTGDSSTASPYTINSINTMLERFGVNIRAQIASMRPKNIAAVMVTATLPAFARAGQKLDITISSIGDAKSLRGGTLLMTPLLAGNNRVYAVAQGSISVGSITASGTSGSKTINHPTVGRIPNGANIERPAPSIMETGQDKVTLMLNTPDFTTVRRIQDAINRDFHMDMAHAIDAGTIEVWNPEGNVIDLLARLEQIEVSSDHQATVIIDERTGTIVMGQDVRIDTVAVAHGSISVNIGAGGAFCAAIGESIRL